MIALTQLCKLRNTFHSHLQKRHPKHELSRVKVYVKSYLKLGWPDLSSAKVMPEIIRFGAVTLASWDESDHDFQKGPRPLKI